MPRSCHCQLEQPHRYRDVDEKASLESPETGLQIVPASIRVSCEAQQMLHVQALALPFGAGYPPPEAPEKCILRQAALLRLTPLRSASNVALPHPVLIVHASMCQPAVMCVNVRTPVFIYHLASISCCFIPFLQKEQKLVRTCSS